ncbi:MAG: energy transducer TonB [Methylobacter sp.]
MYLFESHEGDALTPLGGAAMPVRPLFKALTGQEKPLSMGSLLLTLVVSLHLWAAIWMSQPAEAVTKAQPMIMEVSLIAAPSQKAAAAPIVQPKPEEPKKPPEKKPVKPKKPVTRKQMELPKPLAMADELLPAPAKVESAPAPVTSSAASKVSSKTTDTAPFTEANFNANYGSNPKPKYPGIATSRGWEGTVQLMVKVSAEGDSEEVTVQRSSGHDVLDEAAVEAVERWKFIPAKRGDTPVSSSVIVPINFILNN